MAFTQNTFATVGSQAAPSPTVYSYGTEDNSAVVLTAGYFADKSNQLEQGDYVLGSVGDGNFVYVVSANTDTVVLLSGGGGGSPGFNTPIELSSPTYTALDGDILIITADCIVTFPPASTSSVGVVTRSELAIVAHVGVGGDTIDIPTLTDAQSVWHVPLATRWVKV